MSGWRPRRRQLLATTGCIGFAGLAGCLTGDESGVDENGDDDDDDAAGTPTAGVLESVAATNEPFELRVELLSPFGPETTARLRFAVTNVTDETREYYIGPTTPPGAPVTGLIGDEDDYGTPSYVMIHAPSTDDYPVPETPVEECWELTDSDIEVSNVSVVREFSPDETYSAEHTLYGNPDTDECLPAGTYEKAIGYDDAETEGPDFARFDFAIEVDEEDRLSLSLSADTAS